MSNPDPAKVLFSSRYKYFLNKSSVTATRTVSSQSVGANQFINAGILIPVGNRTDYTQIRLNFSQDPNNWYIFPMQDVDLNATFGIAITGSYSVDNFLDLNMTIFDKTGAGGTTPEFTLTAKVTFFEPPA